MRWSVRMVVLRGGEGQGEVGDILSGGEGRGRPKRERGRGEVDGRGNLRGERRMGASCRVCYGCEVL